MEFREDNNSPDEKVTNVEIEKEKVRNNIYIDIRWKMKIWVVPTWLLKRIF